MTAYCSSCGNALPPASRFCSVCGTAVAGMPPAGYMPPAGAYQAGQVGQVGQAYQAGQAGQAGAGGFMGGQPFFPTRLVRPVFGRQFAGVCVGFARTYGWDVGLVRILTAVAGVFLFPFPELVYLICWATIPEGHPELPPPMQQV